jgi:hypothetical protein
LGLAWVSFWQYDLQNATSSPWHLDADWLRLLKIILFYSCEVPKREWPAQLMGGMLKGNPFPGVGACGKRDKPYARGCLTICLISVISLSVPIIGAIMLTAAGKGLVDA